MIVDDARRHGKRGKDEKRAEADKAEAVRLKGCRLDKFENTICAECKFKE